MSAKTRRELLLTPRPLPAEWHYTPERLREIVKAAGITRATAAGLVGASERGFAKWTLPVGSADAREMPDAAWQWLLILTDNHPYLRAEPSISDYRD